MLPFDDNQCINELPLEMNPNLVPNLSYFPSSATTPSAFYASSDFVDDHGGLLGSIAVANASVAAAASADAGRGDGRSSIHKGTRKGRHSKICTAKGPRDRRMRLSIDVARSFFWLQDTLGFDKASNTVQWLLTMSKAAIKELASVSSSKICTFLGNQSLESAESSNLRCEAASGSKKAASKTKAKKEAAKPSKKTELHSAQAKELRAKARERARERTREKQRMLSSSSFPIALDPMSEPESSLQFNTLLEFANRQVEGGICAALPNEGAPANIPVDTIQAMAEMNMASYMFEEQWEMEALSMYSRS